MRLEAALEAVAEYGEDTFVRSPGGYAANVEAVHTAAPEPIPYVDAPPAHVEDTPNTPTIDTLVAMANERFAGAGRRHLDVGELEHLGTADLIYNNRFSFHR